MFWGNASCLFLVSPWLWRQHLVQCGAPCSSPRKCSRNFLQETIFMTILQKTLTRGIMFKFVSSSFLFLITSKKKEGLCNRPQKSCEKRPPRWGGRQCRTVPGAMVCTSGKSFSGSLPPSFCSPVWLILCRLRCYRALAVGRLVKRIGSLPGAPWSPALDLHLGRSWLPSCRPSFD